MVSYTDLTGYTPYSPFSTGAGGYGSGYPTGAGVDPNVPVVPTFTDPIVTAASNTPGTNLAPKTDTGGSSSKGLSGFGWNTGTLDLVLNGISTIGSLWAAWQSNKLAKEQLAMQRNTTNANFANQIMAYNTALEDKTRHRASFNELPAAEVNSYLNSHRLQKVVV